MVLKQSAKAFGNLPTSSPGTTTDCKLVLLWTPLDASRSSIDPQQDKCRLPSVLSRSPDVCVSILRASDDSIGLRCPRDGSDELVVLQVSAV